MELQQVQSLTVQLLWAVFLLAAVFGAVARHWHFCTMGAVSDIVQMGDWTRMRTWVFAVAVAILGFNGMVAAGWVHASDTIYAAPRLLWLSALVGGGLFGMGMVWASGCGSKTLIRLGGGSLKSLVVFLVMGLFAYATMKGLFAVWRVATIDTVFWELAGGQDAPSQFARSWGGSLPQLAGMLGGLAFVLLSAWVFRTADGRQLSVWLPGLAVGLSVVGMWWLTGVFGHLDEHPETLEEVFLVTNSQRMESLSFTAPMAYVLDLFILFSDKSKAVTVGVAAAAGVVMGSWVHALWSRTFRWEGFHGVEDVSWHLLGAALMGIGGVTAMGCTVGQGLSGLSTLSLGSVLAVLGIVVGAVVALKVQEWRVNR